MIIQFENNVNKRPLGELIHIIDSSVESMCFFCSQQKVSKMDVLVEDICGDIKIEEAFLVQYIKVAIIVKNNIMNSISCLKFIPINKKYQIFRYS